MDYGINIWLTNCLPEVCHCTAKSSRFAEIYVVAIFYMPNIVAFGAIKSNWALICD